MPAQRAACPVSTARASASRRATARRGSRPAVTATTTSSTRATAGTPSPRQRGVVGPHAPGAALLAGRGDLGVDHPGGGHDEPRALEVARPEGAPLDPAGHLLAHVRRHDVQLGTGGGQRGRAAQRDRAATDDEHAAPPEVEEQGEGVHLSRMAGRCRRGRPAAPRHTRQVQISAKTDYALRAICQLAPRRGADGTSAARSRRTTSPPPRASRGPSWTASCWTCAGPGWSPAVAGRSAATGWPVRRTRSPSPTSSGRWRARSRSCTAPARRSSATRGRRCGCRTSGWRCAPRCGRAGEHHARAGRHRHAPGRAGDLNETPGRGCRSGPRAGAPGAAGPRSEQGPGVSRAPGARGVRPAGPRAGRARQDGRAAARPTRSSVCWCVGTTTSGSVGASYGLSTPVRPDISPARCLA